LKTKQLPISAKATPHLASPSSSPTGSSDLDDPFPQQLPPLHHHQQPTSGSIQLSVLIIFHLKINLLSEIGFSMTLLLSETNMQNTVKLILNFNWNMRVP
jgi:hypothetical protein